MDGILKVDPQNLMNTATEFNGIGSQIKGLTQEMMSIIKSMNSIWQGEAATAYSTKFNALQDDMDRMDRMIQEHVKDLNDMAQRYKQAEQKNTDESAPLQDAIIE